MLLPLNETAGNKQPMKFAKTVLVFGGPYSNLRAIDAMRQTADQLGIDAAHTICTGDVVAYCGEPEETVVAVRTWGCHVVAGNCEQQLAQNAEDCGCGFDADTACNRMAKDWYSFAQQRISPHSRAWMAALPDHLDFSVAGRTCRVVHGGIDLVNRFVFGSERDLIAQELAKADVDVVIGGHAGLPFIAQVGARLWFNPGVIGMPANDGTPDVWYGLIEIDGADVMFTTHRLAYDHAPAAAATRAGGHADAYAAALATGLWPSLDSLPPDERTATGRAIQPQSLRLPAKVGLPDYVSA